MSASIILLIVISYFIVLMGISYFTSKSSDNESFFLANKQAPWYLVAFGMIGVSLSGITFVSVPGAVGKSGAEFGYMQMVFGFFVGYFVIAYVLMPIYYKRNLTSIYTYLNQRFGTLSHKTGALFFLVSRLTGAAIRMLLAANILQWFIFSKWGVPFEVTVLISIAMIWLYTAKGGIKTIIWTDTLQTLFMLLALGCTVYYLCAELDFGSNGAMSTISNSEFSKIFFLDDWMAGNHFVKLFFGGMFIAIGMTGLDQDLMQKNLACKNINDAQKNMISFSVVLVVVNLVFLVLGALLYMYVQQKGIDLSAIQENGKLATDKLYPFIALQESGQMMIGVLFVLGIISATYSSADSALTALTTSVCVDFLSKDGDVSKIDKKTRIKVHIIMSIVLAVIIIVFKQVFDMSAIWLLISLAGYTYGPLIGMFFFGIISKRNVKDEYTIPICLVAPVITAFIAFNSADLFNGFQIGALHIVFNSFLTFGLLYAVSTKQSMRKDYTLFKPSDVLD